MCTAVDLLLGVGRAGIDHVHEQVGVDDLLERGPERLDQLVRQALHEPDGVGDEHDLAAGQPQPAGGGVERGEQAVLDEHVGVGEAVEQRRLPRVRVADERDGGQRAAAAGLALRVAVLGQAVEVALELATRVQDAPAVDLELRLTGTAGADQSAAPPPRPAG